MDRPTILDDDGYRARVCEKVASLPYFISFRLQRLHRPPLDQASGGTCPRKNDTSLDLQVDHSAEVAVSFLRPPQRVFSHQDPVFTPFLFGCADRQPPWSLALLSRFALSLRSLVAFGVP